MNGQGTGSLSGRPGRESGLHGTFASVGTGFGHRAAAAMADEQRIDRRVPIERLAVRETALTSISAPSGGQ